MTERQLPTQDDLQRSQGMEKLTRTEFAVRVLRSPKSLAKTRAFLDGCEAALEARDEGFLERAKAKLGLGAKMPSLEAQVKELKRQVKEMETDFIEGVLTPIIERERIAVRAHYTHISLYLSGQLIRPGLTDEIKASNQAAKRAIELVADGVWTSKWVAFSLKKKTLQGLVPYWPENEVPEMIDPDILQELYNAYFNAFVPTQDELGKS